MAPSLIHIYGSRLPRVEGSARSPLELESKGLVIAQNDERCRPWGPTVGHEKEPTAGVLKQMQPGVSVVVGGVFGANVLCRHAWSRQLQVLGAVHNNGRKPVDGCRHL